MHVLRTPLTTTTPTTRTFTAARRASSRTASSSSRGVVFTPRAGPMESISAAIEENKRKEAAKMANAMSSPPGVPPPPFLPTMEPATFGFVENAERMNSRAACVGFFSLLAVEGIFGKGLLELVGTFRNSKTRTHVDTKKYFGIYILTRPCSSHSQGWKSEKESTLRFNWIVMRVYAC